MTDQPRPAPYDDLTAVVGFLLRRWFVLAAAALIGVSAGLTFSMLSEQTFVARQQFVLDGVVNQSQTVQLGAAATNPASLIATQQAILEGDALRAEVERATGRTVRPLSVATTDSSLSYTIAVEDSSPARARGSLVAYIKAYQDYLHTNGSAQIAEQLSLTRQRIDQLEREIRTAKEDQALTPTLNDQLNTQQAILAQLQLQAVTGTTVVSTVGSAVVPATATSLSAVSLALIGAVLAIFLGAVATILWSRFQSAVRLTRSPTQFGLEPSTPKSDRVPGPRRASSFPERIGEAP